MEFQVDPAGSEPIYRQIAQQVREGVARGRLKPHEQLPSSRELSRLLVVNPNTINHAYAELERSGVLYTRRGLGVFVAEPKAELALPARRRRLLEALDRFLTEAVHLGFSEEEVLKLVSSRSGHFEWTSARPAAK
jgi:GntR family transcriptional regulator